MTLHILDEYLPLDLSDLVGSYLPVSDLSDVYRVYRLFYYSEFPYLRIPRTPFHDTVHYGRMHHTDSPPGVRLTSYDALGGYKCEDFDTVPVFIDSFISSEFHGHDYSKEMLTLLLGIPLSCMERAMFTACVNDWLPIVNTYLTSNIDKTYVYQGYQYLVCRLFFRIMVNPEYDVLQRILLGYANRMNMQQQYPFYYTYNISNDTGAEKPWMHRLSRTIRTHWTPLETPLFHHVYD